MDTLPDSETGSSGEGRLANVSGVVLARPGDAEDSVAACAALLGRICESVAVSRAEADDSPLATLVDALDHSAAERVLVLEADSPPASAELVLALVAWPELAIVHPAGSFRSAIYQREVVLSPARARLAAGDSDLAGLFSMLEVSTLDGRDLAAVSEAR